MDAEAYEPIVFSGSSGDAETTEASDACETETFENEAYEHRAFDSQTYENETFAHVADLPYENVGGAEEQDDGWVYEDVAPVPTPAQTTEDRDYEPVCVARAEDEVYEQVREFRRTLKEVNSIVEVVDGKGAELTAKVRPGPEQGPEETCEELVDADSVADSTEDQLEESAPSDVSQEDVVSVEEFQEVLASVEASEGAHQSPAVPEEPQSPQVRAATPPAGREPQMVLFSQEGEETGEDSPIEAEDSEGNISAVSVEPSTSVAVEVAASAAETEPLTRPPNPEPLLTPVDSGEGNSAGSLEQPALAEAAKQPQVEAGEASEDAVVGDEQDYFSEPSVTEEELEREVYEDEVNADEEEAEVSTASPVEPPSDLESNVDNVAAEKADEAHPEEKVGEDVSVSKALPAAEDAEVTSDHKATSDTSSLRSCTKSLTESVEEVKTAPPTVEFVPARSAKECRRPPVARSQTLPTSASVVDKRSEDLPPATVHTGQSGNTWPTRRPADFTTAAVARILPLPEPSPDPRSSSFRSSPADRLDTSDCSSAGLSCKSAPAGHRGSTTEGSALPPSAGGSVPPSGHRRTSDLTASNSDLRRPSLRRASVRQLLSRFEASSGGDIAVQDDLSETEPKLTERAVGSVHEQTSRGSYALATRSLPRPATRRSAGSPDRKRSLPAGEGRPVSPKPVRRHLSFQTVAAPEVRVAGVSGPSFRRTSCEEVLQESAAGGDVGDQGGKRSSGAERRFSQRSAGSCDMKSASLERETRKRPESLPALSRSTQEIITTSGADKSNGLTTSAEASERSALSASSPANTPDAASASASASASAPAPATTDITARERIERYKEERRMLLRERFNADSFFRRSSELPRDRASSSGRSASPPDSPADPAPCRPLRRADSLRSPLSTAASTTASVTATRVAAPAATAANTSRCQHFCCCRYNCCCCRCCFYRCYCSCCRTNRYRQKTNFRTFSNSSGE